MMGRIYATLHARDPMRAAIAVLLSVLGFLQLGLGLLRPDLSAAEAKDRPIVIELFTSQGCSSCPPADRLLTEIARDRDLLPLAFHVTYWNRLGWQDPFSSDAATNRQLAYARHTADTSIFTPQLVVDGGSSVVGSDRDGVMTAIEAAKTRRQTVASIAVIVDGDAVLVRVGRGEGHGHLVLIGFDHEHRTAVGRGENSGRILVESNIVRSIHDLGAWTGAPVSLHAPRPAGEDLAVLLQGDDGHLQGASRLEQQP